MESTMIRILEQAGDQDPDIFKPAELNLRQWETQKGFYTTLFGVFSNKSLPINVRWIAVLYFKNGVDRYWRKNVPGEIDGSEKEFLRRGLISKFDEPVNQLAIQIAVLIAKIARFDCPRDWSFLIPTLLKDMNQEDSLVQHRALLVFYHVIKTLASKRLAADRFVFQELTSSVFENIFLLWTTFTDLFISLTSCESNHSQPCKNAQEMIEKALLALKVLGKLIIHGIDKPSEIGYAMFFVKTIFERLKSVIICRKKLIETGEYLEACDKFIIQLTKILIEMVEFHPLCYIDFIPASLELVVFYCFTNGGQSLSFERLIIQSFNLLKKILQTSDYKPAKIIEETKSPLTLRAYQLKQQFFTREILTEICVGLVTHYFLLTASDLEQWDVDPENFGVDDCGESWKYSLRPCTETVFLAILHQFKDILSGVLVQLIQKHYQLVNPNNLSSILLKDAVYNAVGLAGFDLYDSINFDEWFSTTLQLELKEKSSNYRIIRRRVCWLIGRWTGVKLSAQLRPVLYNLMVEALNTNEDLGVRLAACDALKFAIDDFQFNVEDFSPFIEPTSALLFILLKEVKEYDTKMRVLCVLSFMIERVGSGMRPHIGSLSLYLPDLWKQSEYHNMLRCAIVSTLVHLERSLGTDGIILQPFAVSVIRMSCDLSQESHIYLLEDGLDLWLAVLENIQTLTEDVIDLSTNLPALLESSSENLRLCLHILQAYVLLSPETFLSVRGPVILESLKSIICDLRAEGIMLIMRFLELCLKVTPGYGILIIKPLLLKTFEDLYKRNGCPMVLTMYLSLVARIILNSTDAFVELVRELTRQLNQGLEEDTVLTRIIQILIDFMPLVTQPKRKKLLALALCCIFGNGCPTPLLQYFPRMILHIVETLNDISRVNDIGRQVDSLIIEDSHSFQPESSDCETQHWKRKQRLALRDPVHCVILRDILQNQLNGLSRFVGNIQFCQMMQTIDPEIFEQLKEYVVLV